MLHVSPSAALKLPLDPRGSQGWHTPDSHACISSCRCELWHLLSFLNQTALLLALQVQTCGVISPQVGSTCPTQRKWAYHSLVCGACGLDEDQVERRHEVYHLRSVCGCSSSQQGSEPSLHFRISLVIMKLFCLIGLCPLSTLQCDLDVAPAPRIDSHTP